MVSKVCEAIEGVKKAEDLVRFIEKWGKYLDVQREEAELAEVVVMVNRKS